MFGEPHYMSNGFTIIFERQLDIRRRVNDFEDILREDYLQPQVLPIPDEFQADAPRIIFVSQHGFSQIVVTQVSIGLTINYSANWQVNTNYRREYLLERIPKLFTLISRIRKGKSRVRPFYCGLSTVVRLADEKKEFDIAPHLARIYLVQPDIKKLYDFQLKLTTVEMQQFFSNVTVENYRTHIIEGVPQEVIRLPEKRASALGIQITGDYNDRYAFQERPKYRTSSDNVRAVIEGGHRAIETSIEHLKGASR